SIHESVLSPSPQQSVRRPVRRTADCDAAKPRVSHAVAFRPSHPRPHRDRAKHGGEDNGKLPVTYEQFVEYGIHRHAIRPGIRECEALGFLEVVRGRAGNREYRWPSMYRLTYLPVGRARATNEWQRIATMKEAEAIASAARKTSTGGKQKTSAGKRTGFGVGNHHRKPNFSVPVSVTTVP